MLGKKLPILNSVLMPPIKTLTRYLLGVLFIAAGINHFLNTATYLSIMPPYLPWHLELVYISGIAESALGVLLLIRRYAVWAGWGLVALCIAVFPANLHMAMHADLYPAIPELAMWLRLPAQGLLIAWSWWYTRE
jgi:uncharacterized membrane protein